MDTVAEWFSAERLTSIGLSALRIVLILAAAYVAAKLAKKALAKLSRALFIRMKKRNEQSAAELEKRAETISGIAVATGVVAIWVFASMMVLKEAGFDIGPLLAGAGVLGLAIGFGAQSVVADVLTGAFMLLENQVRMGDVVDINGKSGLVEEINLRTIVFRSLDGRLHIVPNSKIDHISNLTHQFSYYLFDVGVAYKEDTDRVVEVLRQLAEELGREPEFAEAMLEPLDVLGVDAFDDSAVVIKVRIKTKPRQQWLVGREMNRRIKKRFDELGIEIPFPHLSIYFGEASKPIGIATVEPGSEPVSRTGS